jgi:capsule polysaccharide modification protein KpsS
MDQYDEIIQNQLEEGIVERVTDAPKGKEFYIPHKPVVKESAETTKVRIVFDASARENEKGPSLNA